MPRTCDICTHEKETFEYHSLEVCKECLDLIIRTERQVREIYDSEYEACFEEFA